MEKIFGGVDYVDAGECEGGSEKREALAIAGEPEKRPTDHIEDVAKDRASEPERSLV